MDHQQILQFLDEIETQIEQSIGLLGKKFVEEQKFLIVAEQIRPILSTGRSNSEVINHWQHIEQMMDKGYECLMGRRMMSEEEFFVTLQKLRFSLAIAMKQDENDSAASQLINRQIGFEELMHDNQRIFDEVGRGESFSVVREGRVVAHLIPPT